jgi:hypothetical protein
MNGLSSCHRFYIEERRDLSRIFLPALEKSPEAFSRPPVILLTVHLCELS